MNKRRKKLRIANKRRFTAFCMICMFTISAGVAGVSASKPAETYTLCVSCGDTLWDIAASGNTRGKDIRNVIDDIMKLNNMTSTELHVGDIIEIPVY